MWAEYRSKVMGDEVDAHSTLPAAPFVCRPGD